MKKILLLSVLLTQAGYSEKIQFEYSNPVKNQSVDIEGAAIIDVITGDVKVTPSEDVFIVPNQAAVIGINADQYQAQNGDTISVNWQVAYGENCIGTVEGGSASGWSGSLNSNIGSHQKNVTVNNLPATLRITCDNLPAYIGASNTQKDLIISEVEESVVVDSDIVYFRANGLNNSATITQPGNVTISWSVNNASSCTASSSPTNNDWNHTFNPNGSNQDSVNIQETTTLTLTCGTDSKNVQVVLDETVPTGCTTAVYPKPNLVRKSYSYESIKGHPFGTETNGSATLTIENTDFATLKFTAPSSNDFRRTINLIPAPPSQRKINFTTISISQCPGDYSQAAQCIFTKQSNSSIKISTDQSTGSSYCKILPGQEYYLNFVNKDDANSNDTPECLDPSHTSCSILFSEGEL